MDKRQLLLASALSLVACGEATPAAEAPSEVDETQQSAATEAVPAAPAPELEGLSGFWTEAQVDVLLARSQDFDVEADLSSLDQGEREAVGYLLEVGAIFHELYEESRHAQASAIAAHLAGYEPRDDEERGQLTALRRLYRISEGPIAYTLDNERIAFAPVDPGYEPGRNVYPAGTDRESLEAFVAAHPEMPELTAVRTVVRRRSEAQLNADRAVFEANRWLAPLHPGLAARLRGDADDEAYYAVPYSLAYAEQMLLASGLLHRAAGAVRGTDGDLADYFEQRGRDLLTNDYEAGDAAWVSGEFNHLNAQLGAYETYDDHLLGQKAFFSTSILVRNASASDELGRAVARLGEFDAALPGGPYGGVRSRIPIGIYDVVADFGQSRGGNTASILPNEQHITAKYGRTILLRRNIMTNARFLAAAQARFRAAVADAHEQDLGGRGSFDRTVWHEVGHYLGPKTSDDGRTVTEALGSWHNHIEEMKADLVSAWLMPRLVEAEVLDEERRRHAYAAGILRVLVTTQPPRTSAYRTMMLMQQNWFLEHGVLRLEEGQLHIDYERFPAAVESMLIEVLQLQQRGDRSAVEAFIERWARWDTEVQGVIGAHLEGVAPRYWVPHYAALENSTP